MCRMLVAIGPALDPAALVNGLRLMASNSNPAHTHEKRHLGSDYTHEDGWGAAWDEGGVLRTHRSIISCLKDSDLDSIARLRPSLLLLHARKASVSGTSSIENTHPFRIHWRGEDRVFCHNGFVEDRGELRPPSELAPAGTMDSELLFHHVLGRLDAADHAGSVLRALEGVQSYTALHSFLLSSRSILAVSKRHPDRGLAEYHALWETRGESFRSVSSEPLPGIGPGSWRKLGNPEAVLFQRPPS